VADTAVKTSKRADAQRNREKLLAAGAELFAEQRAAVTMEGVAKRAGVGVGTLYRHFPTREALAAAVYRNEVDQVTAAAEELLAELPPDEALEAWLRRFISYATAKRGLREALQPMLASGCDVFDGTRTKLFDAIDKLLSAGAEAGTIRADVDPEDVFTAMGGLWLIEEGPEWNERAMRLLGILMDGLRTR
jgi:AcrR family transcriptional regulator